MAFTWFDKFADAISVLPDEYQDTFIVAIARYGMWGTEPDFSDPVMAFGFEAIREDVDHSKAMRERGAKGGRPGKNQSKEQVKTTGKNQTENQSKEQVKTTGKNQTENQSKEQVKTTGKNQTENQSKEQVKTTGKNQTENQSKEQVKTQYNTEQYNTEQYIDKTIQDRDNTPLSLLALKAFNEIMGTCYSRNPNGEFINSFEGTYTEEDISKMIQFKRDEWWGTRFQNNINPEVLFSPRHFESYIHQSKMPPPTRTGREVTDDELESYGL